MPVNRNDLIRYKTIEQCMQNRYRNWTLEDLIEACSEALYEYEGIEKGVSRRTGQSDIQMMRSDKLGYRAPIVVRDRKYYTYADPDYSITNIPLTDQDLHKLTEVVEFLKQFRGFSHFRELGGMVQKLEDHVHSQKEQQGPVIDFEKNDNLRGLEYLDALYQAILNKRVLHIQYQSFKARQAQHFDFSPYLLKEYKNRWFLIGKRPDRAAVINLALDRMQDLQPSTAPFESSAHFYPDEQFNHTIGVTVNGGLKIQEELLRMHHRQAPYLLTKPLHWSQEEVGRDYYGILLALRVRHNFELEKEILSFGEGVTVRAPERVRRSIQQRLRDAAEHYDNELNEKSLRRLHKSLEFRGSYVLLKVYSRREVQKIRKLIETYRDERSIEATTLPALFEQLPQLPTLLWTPNLQKIVETIAPGAHCVRAIYYERGKRIAGDTQWRQHQRIKVAQQKAGRGYRDFISAADLACLPQALEQNLTCSQSRSHFLRQVKGSPHASQIFEGRSDFLRILGILSAYRSATLDLRSLPFVIVGDHLIDQPRAPACCAFVPGVTRLVRPHGARNITVRPRGALLDKAMQELRSRDRSRVARTDIFDVGNRRIDQLVVGRANGQAPKLVARGLARSQQLIFHIIVV